MCCESKYRSFSKFEGETNEILHICYHNINAIRSNSCFAISCKDR